MTTRFLFTLWASALTLAGCVSSGPPSSEALSPSNDLVHSVCLQTQCEASVQQCRDTWDETCYSCVDDSCFQACATVDCGICTGGSPCEIWRFTLLASSARDEALYRACDRMVAHARDCGATVDGDPCEVFARIERHAMIGAYDCSAGLSCGADTSACDPVPDDSFAQTLDEHALTVCDSALNPDWRDWAAKASSWMGQDARDSVDICLRQTECDSYLDCLDSWTSAVDGSTPPAS